MTKPKQRQGESDDAYALRLKEYQKRISEYSHKRWITMTAEKRAANREYHLQYNHKVRNPKRRKLYAENAEYRYKQLEMTKRWRKKYGYEKQNAQRRKRYAEDPQFRAKANARCREYQFKRRLMTRHPKPSNGAFVDYIESLGMHTIWISRTKKDVSEMTLQELIETQNYEF